jgi:hypothetical protein
VGDKVVDGHLHLLHLLEPEEGLEKQLEVEGVGMVEVVLVHGGQLVLPFIQHLRQAGKGLNEQEQIGAGTYRTSLRLFTAGCRIRHRIGNGSALK